MKRRVAFILLLLVGGAIVNVAVAWGIARWSLPAMYGPFLWSNNRVQDADSELVWPEAPPAKWPRKPMQREAERWTYAQRERFRAEVDTSSSIETKRRHGQAHDYGFLIRYADAMEVADTNVEFAADFLRVGWPLLALGGERFEHQIVRKPLQPSSWSAYDRSVRFAIELPASGGPSSMMCGALLPLRPIWPGFAINTLFYAGILWLLFAGPFALRRRRRIKRGLCPKCAYPIGTSEVCTECGAEVPLSFAAVVGESPPRQG